jgi:hypothetical protein
MNDSNEDGGLEHNSRSMNQSVMLVQTLQGQDVEDAIIEERERDIKQINQDLILVNEMFRYTIVNTICLSILLCMYLLLYAQQGYGTHGRSTGCNNREGCRIG